MRPGDSTGTIATYKVFCEKYGVRICYGITADRKLLEREAFDEIILACGAVPLVPDIPGIHGDNVYLANDVLKFRVQIRDQPVLVLGAGLVGAETAQVLAGYGNRVTLADLVDTIAPQAPARPRENLLDHLDRLGVRFQPGCRVLEILPDGIRCQQEGRITELTGFGSLVLAFGSRPDTRLYESLGQMPHVHRIGDGRAAADGRAAIYEAARLGMEL